MDILMLRYESHHTEQGIWDKKSIEAIQQELEESLREDQPKIDKRENFAQYISGAYQKDHSVCLEKAINNALNEAFNAFKGKLKHQADQYTL